MVSYVNPEVDNHVVLYWACGCESLWVMLRQLLCIIVSSAQSAVVKHGVLCLTSDCDSWCFMLSQWLLFMVCYAEPVVVNHGVLCVFVVVIHVVLCWASEWKSRCECCGSGCESWWAMLSKWLWIIVRYAEPVVVNHDEVCCASGLWIMVCYAVPVVVNHGELCSASGCESWWAILSQWIQIM